MTGSTHTARNLGRVSRAVVLFAAVGALACSLTACAPEPEDLTGVKGQDGISADGSKSWPEDAPDEATHKTVALVPDFPIDLFPIPEDAVIDDNGVLEDNRAFIVLRAPDAVAGEALWKRMIEDGGFVVNDEAETTEGGVSATLTKAGAEVLAVTIPQTDGTVLLSYDLKKFEL